MKRTRLSILGASCLLLCSPKPLQAQLGALDPTFNTTGYVVQPVNGMDGVQKILVQEDGKILSIGMSWDDTFTARAYAFRYLPDGTPDTDFATDGVFMYELDNEALLYSGTITSTGKILLVGATTDYQTYRMLLIQLNEDGTPDASFGTDGVATPSVSLVGPNAEDMLFDVALDGGGKILACGSSYDENYVRRPVVVRFLPNGQVDTSFGVDGVATIPVMQVGASSFQGLLVQPDGKILACGSFGETELWYTLLLVRFDAEGNLDESFSDDGIIRHNHGNVDDGAYDLELNSDGSIVVAGKTVTVNYNYSALLTKFTADGEVDASFGDAGAVEEDIDDFDYGWEVAIQADGKIIMAGTAGNGPPNDFNLAVWKYETDGTPDVSFGENGLSLIVVPEYSTMIYAMDVQADGKILIGGQARIVSVNDNFFFTARLQNDLANTIAEGTSPATGETFPNPALAGTTVTVRFPEDVQPGARISLYNANGDLVHTGRVQQLRTEGSSISFQVPAALSPGTYHLQLEQPGSRLRSTLLIAR